MEAALKEGDSIITAYRCHGWTYIRGVSAAEILCELAGKKPGHLNCCPYSSIEVVGRKIMLKIISSKFILRDPALILMTALF